MLRRALVTGVAYSVFAGPVPPPPPGYLEGLFDELCRLTEEKQSREQSWVAAAAAAAAAEVAPRNLELYMACLAEGDAAATAATAEAAAAATVEAAVLAAAAAAEQPAPTLSSTVRGE